jgi:hypothetical protein
MADTLGPISIPTPKNSGLTFPLTSDFGYSTTSPYTVINHRFGELATKAEQSFLSGIGPTKFTFRRAVLSESDAALLLDFYESVQGSYQSFIYNAPTGDHSTSPVQVVFDVQPLSIQHLATMCQIGLTFLEAPDVMAPSYPINQAVTRFPADGLKTGLAQQVQQIIPLIHIKVLDDSVQDIYLSDRRVTVGSNTYLPRLLDIGEPGTGVIMSQNITGQADNVQFSFGNADRSMVKLANATELKNASIEICACITCSLASSCNCGKASWSLTSRTAQAFSRCSARTVCFESRSRIRPGPFRGPATSHSTWLRFAHMEALAVAATRTPAVISMTTQWAAAANSTAWSRTSVASGSYKKASRFSTTAADSLDSTATL